MLTIVTSCGFFLIRLLHFAVTGTNHWRFVLTTILMLLGSAFAADHQEAPLTQADPAADITDFYAWSDGTTVTAIINFAGFGVPGEGAMYDPDVLYTVNIDNDGDFLPDHSIHVRFGTDSLGAWGVQVSNLPGTGAPVVGPVEAVITAPGGKVFAGLREDPFTFDLTGFNATLASSTLSFDATNDDFAGTNVTSIVIEMDANAAAMGAANLNLWATTARDNSN